MPPALDEITAGYSNTTWKSDYDGQSRMFEDK